MNNLLCRAKRLDNGEWVEGYYLNMTHCDNRHTHHFIIPLGSDLSKNRTIGDIQVEIDPATICRCIGLEDKNGKLIFEGNILHDPYWETDFIVIWKNLSWEIFTAFDTDTDPLDELFDANNKTDAFIIGNTK